eukprot:TRINITY_DN23477_c0_g1_i6.p2 TRINITY_DN23477_c0_g1~~TRINITY_DN23477_c0_g1_i6.p2  ORF type:complete len:217 (+),score=11.94 TRINITY_DN23477_c0_g1_i6:55-651(+)
MAQRRGGSCGAVRRFVAGSRPAGGYGWITHMVSTYEREARCAKSLTTPGRSAAQAARASSSVTSLKDLDKLSVRSFSEPRLSSPAEVVSDRRSASKASASSAFSTFADSMYGSPASSGPSSRCSSKESPGVSITKKLRLTPDSKTPPPGTSSLLAVASNGVDSEAAASHAVLRQRVRPRTPSVAWTRTRNDDHAGGKQ